MDYEQTVSRLCGLPGPSGFEFEAAADAAEMLRPFVDEVMVDHMYSVIGVRRCGKKGAPKLLLDAHLDEVGYIVTGHKDGYLTFTSLGGVDPRILPNQELTLLTDPPLPGIVACLPPHLQSREEMEKAKPMKQLYLDIGMTQEEAVRRVPIGTPAVYRCGCEPMGKGLLCGKAMDDRVCFAAILGTMERLAGQELDVDIYVLGSSQEETQFTGAITGAYKAAPDLCVALDVTHAYSPDASPDKTAELGGGPVIGVGSNCVRWMSERMERAAREGKIPYQIEVIAGESGTNGWPIQMSRAGVATTLLSIPLRYMHTPVETVSLGDLDGTAAVLAAFVRDLGEEVARRV